MTNLAIRWHSVPMLIFALCAPFQSMAQGFPTQPIRVEVGFAPGGVGDISARIVAQQLSESLGQQVLIENRPSAGQAIASEIVAKAAPDGYTLLLLTQAHAVSVSLFKSLPYDAVKDFAPISTFGYFGMAIAVDASSPFKTLAELIAAARAKPNQLNIGTTSIGGTQYIAAELFKSMAGIDFQTVPFKATPSIITAIKGHDVDATVEMLTPLLPGIRDHSLRALGVSFSRRFTGLPDVPTVAEAGVPGYEASSWNGLAAPARTPAPVIDRLNAAVRLAVAQPDVARRLQDLGVDARASTPEELHALLVSETAKWKAVIEKAHIERQ